MYGQIHLCVRSLVISKFGQDAWDNIVIKSGVDEINDFMTFHYYDDSLTMAIVGSAAEILNVPVETVLEVFGDYFLTYCMECGYDKMLLTLGDNLFTFIQNLDSLHALLAMSYKNIDAPSFRCEMEGNHIILHYYSSRCGLYPIVSGLIKAVGKKLFNESVLVEVVRISKELFPGGKAQHHVVFRLELESLNNQSIDIDTQSVSSLYFADEMTSLLTPKVFAELFPFHLIIDSNLRIKQCGMTIQKMFDRSLEMYQLDAVVNLIQPKMPLTFEHCLEFINAIFIFELKFDVLDQNSSNNRQSLMIKAGRLKRRTPLLIKGQLVYLQDLKHLIFIGSPRLTSLTEMQEKNMYLSDIPLYDVTRELVLLNQMREAEIEISKKLDETTAALKETSAALEKEKQKTDTLLYQMLPMKVANSLKEGKQVNAEKFDDATVLFSDIVTFTNIAAVVAPLEIVNMLNSLYMRFDELTTLYQVYKVETIGDAYMIVGGAPDVSEIHAEKVCAFAIDMVEQAQQIRSPATDKPIQIRVGMHSGCVVAGVVGHKMPRYCLFGDTVNTASRMESHGLPGRIHCSPSTYMLIKDDGDFEFEERPEMEIKGKGKMTTYLLTGANNDKYKNLPTEGTDNGLDKYIQNNSEIREDKGGKTVTCNWVNGYDAGTDRNGVGVKVIDPSSAAISNTCVIL